LYKVVEYEVPDVAVAAAFLPAERVYKSPVVEVMLFR
jgi:hypothetical protein